MPSALAAIDFLVLHALVQLIHQGQLVEAPGQGVRDSLVAIDAGVVPVFGQGMHHTGPGLLFLMHHKGAAVAVSAFP